MYELVAWNFYVQKGEVFTIPPCIYSILLLKEKRKFNVMGLIARTSFKY